MVTKNSHVCSRDGGARAVALTRPAFQREADPTTSAFQRTTAAVGGGGRGARTLSAQAEASIAGSRDGGRGMPRHGTHPKQKHAHKDGVQKKRARHTQK